jgi:hypothetical protein
MMHLYSRHLVFLFVLWRYNTYPANEVKKKVISTISHAHTAALVPPEFYIILTAFFITSFKCVSNCSTYRSMDVKVAQRQNWPFPVMLRLRSKIQITLENRGHLVQCVSTNKCAGIVRCFHIFELNRSISSKWKLLGYATIVFSEQYIPKPL